MAVVVIGGSPGGAPPATAVPPTGLSLVPSTAGLVTSEVVTFRTTTQTWDGNGNEHDQTETDVLVTTVGSQPFRAFAETFYGSSADK